jgi:tagatose 6-phosphate kinase
MDRRRIVTITANTAIDRVLVSNPSRPGKRQDSVRSYPAGKGINVARTVATLGKRVLALGFVGRLENRFFRSLRSPLLQLALLPLRGKTRVNVTACDVKDRTTFHQRNTGYRVTMSDVRRLRALAANRIKSGDVFVISGSLPKGAPRSTYKQLIDICKKKHVISILDSSGHDLRHGILGGPFMVKPNLEELESYFGHRIQNSSLVIARHARMLSRRGISLVVVSRGKKGIVVYSRPEDKAWTANVRVDRPIAPTGGVGSGDSLVAGFAVGLLRQWPTTELIRLGVACGAANTLNLGPGLCHKSDIRRLVRRVRICKTH